MERTILWHLKIWLNINLEIILLDYQNLYYVGHLNMITCNVAESFDTLAAIA